MRLRNRLRTRSASDTVESAPDKALSSTTA
jgi:hypothetical protein